VKQLSPPLRDRRRDSTPLLLLVAIVGLLFIVAIWHRRPSHRGLREVVCYSSGTVTYHGWAEDRITSGAGWIGFVDADTGQWVHIDAQCVTRTP
jgi:hypothetical protein